MNKNTPQTNSKILQEQIINAIWSGFLFLENEQRQDGSFEGKMFNTKNKTAISPTPFATSVILTALHPLMGQDWLTTRKEQSIQLLAQRATHYLISQKDETIFAWNYWEHGNPARKKLPLDMDDTALAVASIQLWQPGYIDGAALAHLVQTLLTAELAVGGPYNTWLVDTTKETIWRDCDIAVNANIAYMVSLLGIHLKNLDAYFEEVVQSSNVSSTYYVSPLTILYFISRGYKGARPELFISKIEELRDENGVWNSPMQTSFALSAMHNFGKDISNEIQAVEYILSTQQYENQQRTTFWPKEIFYFERRSQRESSNDSWYHGTECISTSICLEALCLFLDASKTDAVEDAARGQTHVHEHSHASDYEKVSALFINLAKTISANYGDLARAWTTKMAEHDWIRESILLPYFLQDELTITAERSQTDIEQLCLANLCGWIGYTLMDDIMDGDAEVSMFPFIDFCLREMNIIFTQYFSADSLISAKKIFAAIDQAYEHEQSMRGENITSPSGLLPKSIGIAVVSLGIVSDKKHQEAIINFFIYFLSAKQNNDDAEDLLEDIARGHISPVARRVLSVLGKNDITNIAADRDIALSIFWNDVYPALHQEMLDALEKATISIAELPLREDNYFIRMIYKLQTAIRRTNDERRKVQDFLETY